MCVVESVCVFVLVFDEVREEGTRMRLVTLVDRTVEQSMKSATHPCAMWPLYLFSHVIYLFFNSSSLPFVFAQLL